MRYSESNGSFLRADEKSWVSSSLFFLSLNKLKINDKIYHMPIGYHATNAELNYYLHHLYDELMAVDLDTQDEKEAFDYCRKVAAILKSWADSGHSIIIV